MWRERAEEKEAGKEEDEVENDDRMTNPEESDEGRWLAVGDAELRIYIDRGARGGLQAKRVAPISFLPHTRAVNQSHSSRYKQPKQLSITWIT
jgi:hypothetical protein